MFRNLEKNSRQVLVDNDGGDFNGELDANPHDGLTPVAYRSKQSVDVLNTAEPLPSSLKLSEWTASAKFSEASSIPRRGEIVWIKTLQSSCKPLFTKIPKYSFNTSNGTETITVSTLFRRLKNTFFF